VVFFTKRRPRLLLKGGRVESNEGAEFWHCRCLRTPLSSKRTYTLYLEIKTPDSSSAATVIVFNPDLEQHSCEFVREVDLSKR
jgi:hypothetical protein